MTLYENRSSSPSWRCPCRKRLCRARPMVLNHGLPDGLIQANGRIEGDHVTIASKFPGRVQELLVREGATVTQGQVLIRLDSGQTAARVQQARHAAEALEAQVQGAHTNLAILNLDVPLAIERADAQVAKARIQSTRPFPWNERRAAMPNASGISRTRMRHRSNNGIKR